MRQVAQKDGSEIDGETLQMLLFADDVVLVASKPETLQSLLNEICHLTERIGLKIHPGKTKWMKNTHCDDFEIKLNNQLVERVEHYVYLGQAIRMDNDLRLELSRRRKAGWTAFSKIDVLLKSKDIPARTKSQLFHSSVLPALLYGCETWNLTKAEERSLQKAVEQPNPGQAATPSSFLYEGVNIMDAPNIVEQNGDSSEVLTPEVISSPEVDTTGSSVGVHTSASTGEFQFPDVVISTDEPTAEISLRPRRKPSVMERIFPKLSPSNNSTQGVPSLDDSDYLVKAAHLVSTAQRAEHEHAYELAFQCYKNAASSLIQGIQHESDMARRNAVRRKTAKYLVAAERLYRAHLAYDGAAPIVNLESLVESTMMDPDVLAFQCANACLKNYRVVGVLPSINAIKWVLKVEEKSTGRLFVMKLLEKGVRTPKSRVLLPTNVPHMVQLYQFFETETYIILVLDYVECGTLWSFLSLYFAESEKRFLLSLAAGDDEGICDVAHCSTMRMQPTVAELECYRGRRLHFSVGVDFERVAEMRDETQSSDVPSTSGVVCTMGEDATGVCSAPEGDFYLIGEGAAENVSLKGEESPARVRFPSRQDDDQPTDEMSNQSLLASISSVRSYLRRERRRAWPGRRPLPETLIVHWSAQLVSWLYVMHNEHAEVIGDLRPDNLLVGLDGNLQMTYYGKWHNTGRPKDVVEGYSAPDCFKHGWVPNVANDVWTLGAIMFELLSGRALVNAAPHGVTAHSTAPCVALPRQDRHTIRQMRHDTTLLAVRGRSHTAPSGVAADEHCSRSFVSIFR
ncbi:hypothetical protein Y032_0002g572 [Ancylostoma ceylanicum]|nr:hypothetical protein Y032_0002g572 [Ancylostoma ceylanicum]